MLFTKIDVGEGVQHRQVFLGLTMLMLSLVFFRHPTVKKAIRYANLEFWVEVQGRGEYNLRGSHPSIEEIQNIEFFL